MQCCVCKEKPATVHLTQIVDEKTETLHLCQHCAGTRGVNDPGCHSTWDLVFEPETPPAPVTTGTVAPIMVGTMDLSLLMNPLLNRKWLNEYLCNAAFVKKSPRPSI